MEKPEILDSRVEDFWFGCQAINGLRWHTVFVSLIVISFAVDRIWFSQSELSKCLSTLSLVALVAVWYWAVTGVVNRSKSLSEVDAVHIWTGTSVGVVEYFGGGAYLFSGFSYRDYRSFWELAFLSGAFDAGFHRHKISLPEDRAITGQIL